MADSQQSQALAKRRFIWLQIVRFSGVILVFIGAYYGFAETQHDAQLQRIGKILMVTGVVTNFFLPFYLKKRWNKADK